jgi:hypothetical protein
VPQPTGPIAAGAEAPLASEEEVTDSDGPPPQAFQLHADGTIKVPQDRADQEELAAWLKLESAKLQAEARRQTVRAKIMEQNEQMSQQRHRQRMRDLQDEQARARIAQTAAQTAAAANFYAPRAPEPDFDLDAAQARFASQGAVPRRSTATGGLFATPARDPPRQDPPRRRRESRADSDDSDDTPSSGRRRQTVKLPLPIFSGTPGTFRHFLRNFTAWADMACLSDTQRASAMSNCLKEGSTAAAWLDSLYAADDPACFSWRLMQPRMQERFDRVMTPGELTKMIDALRQTKGQSVDEFADAVRRDMFHLTRDLPRPMLPELAAVNGRVLEIMREHFSRVFFLQGLQPAFRQLVCASNAQTYAEYVEAARRSEGTARDLGQHAVINVNALDSVEDEIKAHEAEIAALRARGGGRGGNRRGGGGGRGRGGGGGGGNTSSGGGGGGRRQADDLATKLPADMCAECGKMGHWKSQCPNPEDQSAWFVNGYAHIRERWLTRGGGAGGGQRGGRGAGRGQPVNRAGNRGALRGGYGRGSGGQANANAMHAEQQQPANSGYGSEALQLDDLHLDAFSTDFNWGL